MPYIHRIEVVNRSIDHPILISEAHEDLPEDRNYAKSKKAETGDAVLYHRDRHGESERAFAWSSRDKNWTIEIEIRDLGQRFDGKRAEVAIWDYDTLPHPNPTIIGFSTHGSVSDHITIAQFSGDGSSPLGFFGTYNFGVRVAAETSDWDSLGQVPLEAYYLSTPGLPDYFKAGIQLLFLRMFVLPQRNRFEDRSSEGWVRNVTEICFGSRKPFRGEASSTKDHWLVYNTTGGGSSSFTNGDGSKGLNLSAWLDAYRNHKQHGVVTRVNCYDQAASTEIALCLGISHKQIHWEYHQVYGYINAELVGWGKVNNPYFDGVKTQQYYETATHKDREPFRNHAYLSWSKTEVTIDFYKDYNEAMKGLGDHNDYVTAAEDFEEGSSVKRFMIDSCAGPHVGNETRKDYEKNVTHIPSPKDDHSAYVSADAKRNPERWVEEHELGSGVTENYTLLPLKKLAEYRSTADRLMKIMTYTNPSPAKINPDIKAIQHVFFDYVNVRMRPRWNQYRQYMLRPYVEDGTTIYEYKINFCTGAHIRLDRAAALRILINDEPRAAQAALAKHLAAKGLSIESRSTTVIRRSSVYELVKHWKTVAVVGTYYVRGFAWNNVAVEVTVEQDEEWEECDNASLNMLFLKLIEV